MINANEKIICPLCQNDSAPHFASKNGHSLYKCRDCGFLFVFPLPDSITVYDKTYFSGAENGFGYVDYDSDKEPMVPTFQKYIDVLNSLGVSSGRLLDVGAATGFFMKQAIGRGFEARGIEISDFAASKGRSNKLDIMTGDLLVADLARDSFDVVTMLDVLEHVPKPKKTLEEARKILKTGGLLVINTPDAQSLWAKAFGSKWHLIIPPEHIHYFGAKNLAEYLSKHGFKVLVNTKIGKKFTFQYIFKMLYSWQGFKIWSYLAELSGKRMLSKFYIPINLYDNLFMIVEKE